MAPTMNITITVPVGTSNHGDPNLLCTPAKWYEVLLFYAVNYLAHAVTVKALPGEQLGDTIAVIFAALIYPYSGVLRGIEAIARHAAFSSGNALQKAARAGALCIVVRSLEWAPQNGQVVKGVEIKSNIIDGVQNVSREKVSPSIETTTNSGAIIPWRLRFPNRFQEGLGGPVVGKERNVHGAHELPQGYTFAILPSNAIVEPNFRGKHSEIAISSSYSLIKAIVSIVQVLFASATLYRTRGDQLNQYGYAAFGLTVIPYIVMSIVNLFGNLLTPDFATLYLVWSPELREAESHGGHFDGVVGTVRQRDDETTFQFETTDSGFLLRAVSPISNSDATTANNSETQPHSGNDIMDSNQNASSSEADAIKILPVSEISTPPSTTNQEYLANRVYRLGPERTRQPREGFSAFTSLASRYTYRRYNRAHAPPNDTQIFVSPFTPFQKTGYRTWGPMRVLFGLFINIYILTAIPYAVIGGLTHFHAGHATKAQKVWTMGWLAFGTGIGAAIPIGLSVSDTGTSNDHRNDRFISKLSMIAAYSAFAIGGLVVVGQMLVEYGSCNSLT